MRPKGHQQLATRALRGEPPYRAKARTRGVVEPSAGRRLQRMAWAVIVLSVAIGSAVLLRSRRQPEPTPTAAQPAAISPSINETPREEVRRSETPVAADRKQEHQRLSGSVQSTTGAPLARANVCILPTPAPVWAPPSCVQSDGAGRFTLDVPAASASVVFASAEGYLALRRPLLRSSAPLVLSLEAGGVQLTGSVLDASGGSIVDALVSATAAGETQLGVARTGSTGQFVMTVPAGRLQLSARADGYASVDRLVNAPQAGVELVLTPPSSIRGRVLVAKTEAPVAGAEVTLFSVNGLAIGARSATTDERGAFQMGELPAGDYFVGAASAEWRSAERRVALEVAEEETLELLVTAATRLTGSVTSADASCHWGEVRLEGPVSAGRALDENGSVEFLGILPGVYRADVWCEPGLELTDQIEVGLEPVTREWQLDRGSSVTGIATTWTGAPLAGARVEVEPIGEPSARRSVFCVSDERGAFTCSGLEPGPYECLLRENSVARSESVRVTLKQGSAPPEVALRASPTATLSLRLEGADALQLGAFAVVAERKGAAPLVAKRSGTDFVFEQIPLGVYEVKIEPEVPGGLRTVELARAGAEVALSSSAPVAQALSGRVVDEAGNGVPDAWVSVAGASLYGALFPASAVLSDAEGAFTIPGLLRGSYELSATSSRGQAQLDEVVNDGRRVNVPLHSSAPP
jgi:hypothetical protein